MGGFGSVWHWVVVLAVVILLFGAKKIPELAKGLGSGIKNFKKAVKEEDEEETTKIQDIEGDPRATRKKRPVTKQITDVSGEIITPKKRGRKPKISQVTEIKQGPKKRGRKPKSQTTV